MVSSTRMKVDLLLLLLMFGILVLCVEKGSSQNLVRNLQFLPNNEARLLSEQQQGQILSDIQQHQRTDLGRNKQNFQPQEFATRNAFYNQAAINQNQQQYSQANQNTQNIYKHDNFARNEYLSTLPLVNSLPTSILPTAQIQEASFQSAAQTNQNNKILQTQQNQNNFPVGFLGQRQDTFGQQYIKPRPTQDPIELIEQQIKSLHPENDKQKINELKEKQAIIEKHNQFVQRQYEKALQKVKQDHESFSSQQKEQKKKIYERLYKIGNGESHRYNTPPRSRVIYPEEVPLFAQAIKQYYIQHPTTTAATTTTTSTTSATTSKPRSANNNSNTSPFLPTVIPSTKFKEIQSLEDLDQLQKQYRSQRIRKDDLLEQLRLAISRGTEDDIVRNISSREISSENGKKLQRIPVGKQKEITLSNGKTVTVVRADDSDNKNDEEVTLPSGHRVQIIRTTNPDAIPNVLDELTLPNGQKAKLVKQKPKSLFNTEEITLPNGEKVEVIKTTDPNLVPGGGIKVEPGSDLEKLVLSRTTTTTTLKPPQQILEEITKNVPASNYEILKPGSSGSLESVGKNLPDQKKITFVLLEEQSDGTLKVQGIKGNGKEKQDVDVESILKKIKQGEIKLPPINSETKKSPTNNTTTQRPSAATTVTANLFSETDDLSSSYNSYTTHPQNHYDQDNIPALKTNIGTELVAKSTATTLLNQEYIALTQSTARPSHREPNILNISPQDQSYLSSSLNSKSTPSGIKNNRIQQKLTSPVINPTEQTYEQTTTRHAELPNILKQSGLFAMAKFLKQSGLDTILNETGPYTIFVPTDKAFRTLLVQLGGPEKAEEKFRENPRLLSGLLLHHVIPGSFKIESLQDEMTGVSLAGTQLRVNQYNMHDAEWNDIKISTINGAKILDEMKDIEIPQGIAHTIDKVMFPLPVGDIIQTLQSDRERRFKSLLRAIFASGLAEMLQGTKTFTLFAPTEKAFSSLSTSELNKIVTDKTTARELVLRHLLSDTLYTNGIRYYQVKDSLLDDKQLTFSKQSGKVKVNNIPLGTQNIPSTNGVIHAVDTLL